MTLRLNGSTSGYTEIDAPAVAGSNTLVLPGGNGSAGQYLQTNGSGTLSWSTSGLPAQVLTLGTSVASTSGTAIDFTGIPSTVKRITIMFSELSLNGGSSFLFQIGTSAGIVTTGYSGGGLRYGGSTVASASFTTGLSSNNATSSATFSGQLIWTNISGNIWSGSINYGGSGGAESGGIGGSSVTLSGTLDRVRITTVNGTDTFDAGTINIMYEG